MANIDISNIANEINKQLAVYTEEVSKKVSQAIDDSTKEGVKMLKAVDIKLTGDYRKGWARKKEGTGYVIHNKTDYQLTHLLEYGHAKVGGGRVGAIPHIRPVEEKVIADFEEKSKEGDSIMTLAELNTILKATGFPVAYSHFVVTSLNPMPKPPYITYLEAFTSNKFADNKVHHKAKNMQIELYTIKKDEAVEKKLEAELDWNEIPYDATETYIESEKLYQRIYETRLI